MQRRILFFILPILLLTSAFVRGRSSASFSIVARWHIGGDGAWNRLTTDPVNHRLYVTRGDKILVVDTLTGKQSGEITGSKSIRAVCLNPNGRTGYFTDASGMVRVFDQSNLQLRASIPAGTHPDTVVFDSKSNTLFVLDDRGPTGTLVESSANRPLATIALPGRPAAAVTDGQGIGFVSISDSKELVRIDLLARKLSGTWPLLGCSGPTGLAIDSSRHQLYSICENNRLLVLDARTGRHLSSTELPEGTRDIVF